MQTFTLPPEPPPARRGALPLAAAVVPVAGAVAMWLITGSLFALWFAALGPLLAVASVVDARRAERRDRRRQRVERERAVDAIRARVHAAHDTERRAARARHPDVAAYAEQPAEIWRAVPGRAGLIAVGRGEVVSEVRVEGDDDAAALCREAETVTDAPVVVPAAGGIAVIGPAPFAAAVARGFALQLLCQSPPGTVHIEEPVPEWARGHPARSGTPVRLAPPFAPGGYGVATLEAGAAPPPGCAAVVTLTAPDRGMLDHDGSVREVRVEAVAESQAQALMAVLNRRGTALGSERRVPQAASFDRLPAASGGALAATVGVDAAGPFRLDLAADGPHAVVAGMTGSGKSELLVTWVAAMAAVRGPDRVNFLLIDFKGGTAFRRLAALPHVTGILTDLDEHHTRRAVEALRAEIRRREAELAAVGASDIDHPAARLPRLVVVVDEFAALLQQAGDLAAVFTDVAARGRALGIHLVLGTQRPSGVVREALLANCPLRVGLRVTDAADSRYLLGSDAAFAETERGIAHVRTATSAGPVAVRVALTAETDIAALAAAARGAAAREVWLPPLPERLPVGSARRGGVVVLGLADEPQHQRQREILLEPLDSGLAVAGGPGSGRSALLAAIAEQQPGSVSMPRDPENAWDALAALADEPPQPGTLLLCDDLDLLLTRFPPDYAQAVIDRIVELARAWGMRPIVSYGRAGGVLGRVIDVCSRRALLRMPSRLDHIGAGGDPSGYEPDAPAGRGTVDGLAVQFVAAARAAGAALPPVAPWHPQGQLTLVVAPAGAASRRLSSALAAQNVHVDGPAADPAEGVPRVLVADPDGWQRAWARFTTLRGEADLLIAAECAAEYRLLSGDRALPPYCEPARGRGWLIRDGLPATRVLLPGAQDRPLRAVV